MSARVGTGATRPYAFAVGDVVQLCAGGPRMTVSGNIVLGTRERVQCVWFEGSEAVGWHSPCFDDFDVGLLVRAGEGK